MPRPPQRVNLADASELRDFGSRTLSPVGLSKESPIWMATAFGPSLGRFGLVAATYKNAQGWAVAPDSQTDSALGRQGCFVKLASWGEK